MQRLTLSLTIWTYLSYSTDLYVCPGRPKTDSDWLVIIIMSLQSYHHCQYRGTTWGDISWISHCSLLYTPQVNLWLSPEQSASLSFSLAWYHSMDIVFHYFFFIVWLLHWFSFCSTSLHSFVQDWCFHLVFSLLSFWTFLSQERKKLGQEDQDCQSRK